MRILVIGGGIFVGRAVADAAVLRGHEVTLFNRGKSAAEVPPGMEWIKGDRNEDLGALGQGLWDAVIDTCAYFPRHVESMLKALHGRTGTYLLVSSVSVYADLATPGIDEAYPMSAPTDPAALTVTPENYGPLKAMCERSAVERGPASTLLIRPGIIVGPRDPTGRFAYWMRRVARGTEMLAPGRPDSPLQVIDVRDLGPWMVAMLESGAAGPYNAVGPEAPLTWREMLCGAAGALGTSPTFTWADDAFIDKHSPSGALLPLYVAQSATKFQSMYRVSGKAAMGRGLKLRPLASTIADTARWLAEASPGSTKEAGVSIDREVELLREWHLGSA
jgi:2'-hydroxyisoflavone reductase